MNAKVKSFLVKYTMVIVLVIVFILFIQITEEKWLIART